MKLLRHKAFGLGEAVCNWKASQWSAQSKERKEHSARAERLTAASDRLHGKHTGVSRTCSQAAMDMSTGTVLCYAAVRTRLFTDREAMHVMRSESASDCEQTCNHSRGELPLSLPPSLPPSLSLSML